MSDKIAIAMSGGVDSSVAAALCVKKYGKENVFGVTMKLFCYGGADLGEKNCCSFDAANDAKKVCDQLGIAHYVIGMEKEFEKAVIENFLLEYQQGHTPNPCVLCNQIIKFDYLLKKIKELGADKLATGHYARIREITNYKLQITNKPQISNFQLLKGKDNSKDQSYFLYGIKEPDLSDIIFPVGDINKSEVRKIAKGLNLRTAEKKESQEICFVTGKTEDYLREKIEPKPGKMIDESGKIIGEHAGIHGYTIGQRKGLGGGAQTPLYVTGINSNKNQIIIGPEASLYGTSLMAESINWFGEVEFPLKCSAKIRYRMEDAECTVKLQFSNNKKQTNSKLTRNLKTEVKNLEVVFREPQRAITPGQSIAFYKGDVVIAGGIIVLDNITK